MIRQPEQTADWPAKVDLFGLQISVVDYERACEAIIHAARQRTSAVVSCHAAHSVVTFSSDPRLRTMANGFEMVTPDGQPVRWAMNWFHKTGLRDRVYGPELMRQVCRRAAAEEINVFLYGGANETILQTLTERLNTAFPGIRIVGTHCPPFRDLTDEEREVILEQIRDSGAQIVFIGLGCPKQDFFAHDNRNRIDAVQICVGAAFDFHAGSKKMAPPWMQRWGLEWLFRLTQEPRRLGKRYLVTNSQFLWRVCKQTLVGNRNRMAE